MKKAVIFDIDGTIADMESRVPHKADKQMFYQLAQKDKPISGTIAILNKFIYDPQYEVFFITSRPEYTRSITREWLIKHVFGCRLIQEDFGTLDNILYMRDNDDKRIDVEVKKDIYQTHIQPHYLVDFVIEDRQRVVNMWRELGLLCLQTCEGKY